MAGYSMSYSAEDRVKKFFKVEGKIIVILLRSIAVKNHCVQQLFNVKEN